MHLSWNDIAGTVEFTANLVTATLGATALWGLVFRRKQFSLALKVLLSFYLGHRVSRLKESLGRLESLNYDNKDDRGEIHALLGQVCGQVGSLLRDYPALDTSYKTLVDLVEKRVRISESKKRQITYEIHGQLDSLSFNDNTTIIGTKDA